MSNFTLEKLKETQEKLSLQECTIVYPIPFHIYKDKVNLEKYKKEIIKQMLPLKTTFICQNKVLALPSVYLVDNKLLNNLIEKGINNG